MNRRKTTHFAFIGGARQSLHYKSWTFLANLSLLSFSSHRACPDLRYNSNLMKLWTKLFKECFIRPSTAPTPVELMALRFITFCNMTLDEEGTLEELSNASEQLVFWSRNCHTFRSRAHWWADIWQLETEWKHRIKNILQCLSNSFILNHE